MYAQNTFSKSIVLTLILIYLPTNAFAQISKERIEELKARAIKENWPFKVGETSASKRPVEVLCGYAAGGDSNDVMMLTESSEANPIDADIDLPVRFDWRDYNVVPPPRDQGDCNSCYAFAATGIVESAILIRSHLRPDYMDLSEQWIVSCCPWAWEPTQLDGCHGGDHAVALDHIRRDIPYAKDDCDDKGAVPEQNFPYVGQPVDCGCPYPHHYWIEARNNEPGLSSVEEIKKAIYLYGPVATVVHAGYDAFIGFKGGGIFTECESGGLDHVVIFVGWDDDPNDPNYDGPGVWLLRNSWWAPDPNEPNDPNEWGDDGYMRIPYDCPSVGSYTYYVTLGNDFYLPQPGLLSMTADIENGEPNVLPIDPNRDEITYIIHYGNPVTDANDPNYIGILNNVIIVDYLPEELDVNFGVPDSNYNYEDHSYRWNIGTLQPGESNSVTLTVTVNQSAEPLGTIKNFCKIESDKHYAFADIDVNVGCWDPGTIYVDDSAVKGANTGMSWKNAYTTIQKAVVRATRDCNCGRQILVAAGTYQLGDDETLDFADKAIKLSGTNPYDPNVVANTIITGSKSLWVSLAVVTLTNSAGSGSAIRGLTLANHGYGVSCTSTQLLIDRCIISGHFLDGINCAGNSDVTITNCRINNNGSIFVPLYGYGISVSDSTIHINGCTVSRSLKDGLSASSSNVEVTNSKIRYNNDYGVYLAYCTNPALLNNWIHNNNNSGIYLSGCTSAAIRNNTIVNNLSYGIYCYGGTVDVNNCIVCDNPSGNLYGCTAGNDSFIGGNPLFVKPADPNDYHLLSDSPCIDAGDPAFNDFNETDLDGECRIMDGDFNGTDIVDIGADEYYWPKADYDKDFIVDFNDYCTLAGAWRTVNPAANLVGFSAILLNDIEAFCSDWLWVAPWSAEYEQMMMAGGDDEGMVMLAESTVPAVPLPALSYSSTATTEAEPLTTERIEELIDWTEQLLENNPELKETLDESKIQKILDSLKEELN